MLKEVTTRVSTLKLDGFTLTAEGIMDDVSDWTITMLVPDSMLAPRSWKRREFCVNDEDVEEMLWEEALITIQKYAFVCHDDKVMTVDDDEDDE